VRQGIVLLLAAIGLGLSACGSDDEPTTPTACLAGPDPYVEALQAAPDDVFVGGETPIGECLVEAQGAGGIEQVGEAMVAAATELNRRARRQPAGQPTVQLGYLVGAVDAATESTAGIHQDLALRVEAAALFIPEDQLLPAAFQQRYEEGYAAGQSDG
jgi:hypothetical protein